MAGQASFEKTGIRIRGAMNGPEISIALITRAHLALGKVALFLMYAFPFLKKEVVNNGKSAYR